MSFASTVRLLRLRSFKYLHRTFYTYNIRCYRSSLLPPHTKIKMPSIGKDNEAGEIVKWYKTIGDKLKIDDAICEIEMDDLTLDLEAEVDGYLAEISIPDGLKVKCGTTIARQVGTEKDLETFIDALKNSRDTAERDLIFAYRILSDLGYGSYINMNHLSVSIPISAETPWSKTMITGKDSFCWHNITKKDLIQIDIEQVIKEKQFKNTMNDIDAMDIYCALIKKTPTINTLFHINTPSLLTLSSIKPNELLMINPLCARFSNRIIYVESLHEIYDTNFITFANVIVIKNFGVIVTGSSIQQAFDTFFYFDKMVKLQLEILRLQNSNSQLQIMELDEQQIHEYQSKYQVDSHKIAKQHFDARKRSILEKEEHLLQETQE